MQIRLLGPLEVVGPKGPVTLGRAKERALLAVLALHANEVVSEDRLLDALWGEEQPRTANKTLQSYVSRLRRALGSAGGELAIETAPGGYRLRAGPVALDVARVEELVGKARAAVEAGDHAWAAVALAEALGTWRGEALGELAAEPWALAEVAGLAERRGAIFEELLEAKLACGRHAEVIAQAEAALAEHPLREGLWAKLMIGLYRAGRQADALRAYQRLRTVLGEELGLQPSPELVELEGRVLAHDPGLALVAKPRPVAPTAAGPSSLPSGVVTFLLTDVAGSTRLWDAHAAEMAQALVRHDAVLRNIVETYGGVLLKARGEGDSTFSVFARATDAVAASRMAQRTLAAEVWPASVPLRVRMALHTGEALEHDGDYYGPAVNRVARLRELAEGGQVLVSRSTADVVVDHLPADCELVELGTQALRDLARPENVFLLAVPVEAPEPVAAPERLPLPGRLATPPPSGFHGRVAERDLLAQRRKEAAAGERRVVLVAGEPGIGKTSLAAEAARAASAGGATVLYGRCDEDLGLPYQPWIEALDHLVARGPPDLAERLGRRRAADLARLVPALARQIGEVPGPMTDPEAERYLLFGAVLAALGATGGPVVLVLDDLHWADKPTLLLLRHLVGASEPKAILVIATYRDSELSTSHPLTDVLAALRREPSVERLALGGLADDELVAAVEAAAGQPLEGAELAVIHAVYRETDGNPFFAWEIMRHLTETGMVSLSNEGRWVAQAGLDEGALPDSVREVVGRRVARLGQDVQRALSLAAVIGRDFDLEVLAAALDADPDEILAILEKAEVAGLVSSVTPGRFSFAHALISHTLSRDLTSTRRAWAHRSVAEAMERLGLGEGRLGELAGHWAAASVPLDSARAIDYARQAGDQALAVLAPDEALRWYTQALGMLPQLASPDEALRCELLLDLGDAQRQTGDPAFRQTLLDAAGLARDLADTDRLVRAALTNNRGTPVGGQVDPERIGVLETALATIDAGDSAERARLMANLSSELVFTGDFPRRKALADEALAMARRLDDPEVLVQVILGWSSATAVPETLDERLAVTAEGLVLAESLGDPIATFWAAHHCDRVALAAGQRDKSDRYLDRRAELAEEVGQPILRWFVTFDRSGQALLDGRAEDAERLAAEALELGQASGQPDALAIFGAGLLMTRWHQGQEAELVDLLAQVAADTPDLPIVRAGVALVFVGAGRGNEVTVDLAELDALPYNAAWLMGIAMWAEVAAGLQHVEAARVLYERLAPFPTSVAGENPVHLGAVAHYLGALATVLGRHDDAEVHFAQAEGVHERLRAPFHLARTHLEWGRMLLARGAQGDHQRAVELLGQAQAAAQQYGCGGVERRAAEALATATRILPPALAASSDGAFVGRADELERLRAAWGAASAGQRQVVLVGGEPGIGKTSLAGALARAVHAEGATVLYGACEEELGVPYQPFAEAVRAYVAACPIALLKGHIGRAGGDLARLVPGLKARIPDAPAPMTAEAESERYRMFEAAADLLGAAAEQAPVLLVLDDLQWATKATLLLFRHLVRAAAPSALLVAGLYRDTEATGELAGMLADLRRTAGVERISLAGLDEEGVAALLDSAGVEIAGGERAALAQRLHAETDGSPFLVAEVVRHLALTGVPGDAEELDVPASVREVVGRQLGRLSEPTRQLLTTAAVIGPSFAVAVLERVEAEVRADALLDGLEQAIAAGLLRESGAPGQFAFAHALIRHALYDDIGALRRARLHRRVGEAIEALPGPAESRLADLASHYLAAAADGVADKAVEYATRAGQAAVERVAYEEAVRFYQQALEVLDLSGGDETAAACDVMLALADARWRAGDTLGSRETYSQAAELARRLGDADRLASAALRNLADLGGYSRSLRVDHELVALLEEALDVIGADDGLLRAQLLARLAVELSFTPEPARRVELSEAAVAMAERLRDPRVLLFTLNCREWATTGPDTPIDARLATAESIARLAEQLGDREVAYQANFLRLVAFMEVGDFDAADREADRGERLADELHTPGFLPWVVPYRAMRAWMAGRIADARRLNQEALDVALATRSDPELVWTQIGGQGLVLGYLRRAEMEAALPVLEEMAAQPDIVEANPTVLSALCVLYGLLDRKAECRAVFDDLIRRDLTNLPRDRTWITGVSIVAIACGRLRAADQAAALYEPLASFADRWTWGAGLTFGPVSQHLGVLANVLGRYDDAERHLLDAIERTAAASAPIFHAAACCDYAVLLAERDQPGDRERAREFLDRCETIATDLELTTLLEWVRELRSRLEP